MGFDWDIHSVNLTVFAIEAMAIEIVDLPIQNGDCPYFFVCLPEGSELLQLSQTGWWFGTMEFYLSIQLEMSSSQVTPSFFRGVGSTTNQIWY